MPEIANRINIVVGEFFDSKYEILQKIGSGTFGNVYKVSNRSGNVYALKLLHLWDIAPDLRKEEKARFRTEYDTARLDNKYLVRSSDYGEVQGNPYMTMEYCPEGDIERFVKEGVPSNLAHIAANILGGLHFLNSEGKIHRDLKPANVLMKSDGQAALTDFGTVGHTDPRRQSQPGWNIFRKHEKKGTPLYMCPEIFDGRGGGVTYLPTVDIWSFGVMMYEIITGGHMPFGDISELEEFAVYQRNARRNEWNRDLLRRSLLLHGMNPLWNEIIENCLVPDYRQRYQSPRTVLDAMAPMLEHRVIHQTIPSGSRSLDVGRLLVTQGDNVGKVYDLHHCLRPGVKMVRVGRHEDNDIVLPDTMECYLSRYHFTLQLARNGRHWIVRDGQHVIAARQWVASTNGTFLNSQEVPAQDGTMLHTGDIITAGEYKLKVVGPSEDFYKDSRWT